MEGRRAWRTPGFRSTSSAVLGGARGHRAHLGPGLFLNDTSRPSTKLRPDAGKPLTLSWAVIPFLPSSPEFYFWTTWEHLPRLADVETSSLQVPYDIWVQLCGKVLEHAMECSSLFSWRRASDLLSGAESCRPVTLGDHFCLQQSSAFGKSSLLGMEACLLPEPWRK